MLRGSKLRATRPLVIAGAVFPLSQVPVFLEGTNRCGSQQFLLVPQRVLCGFGMLSRSPWRGIIWFLAGRSKLEQNIFKVNNLLARHLSSLRLCLNLLTPNNQPYLTTRNPCQPLPVDWPSSDMIPFRDGSAHQSRRPLLRSSLHTGRTLFGHRRPQHSLSSAA